MKKFFTIVSFAVLTIGLLGSCEKDDPKVSVTGVTLDKTTLTITVGDADVKLTATVAPDNATDKTVSWSSDKTEFATVDNQGNVHAVAEGTANITVTTTDGGKTATCAVTVKAALPAGALSGEFSVSADKKVHFSQGNLFWNGSAFTFEANQYDSPASWNTSHVGHFFWSKDASVATADTYSDASAAKGDVFFTNASGFKVNVGGAEQTGWRTLSSAEWIYLLNTRTVNGGQREGKSYSLDVTYSEKDGMVIYPDNYIGTPVSGTVTKLPEGVVFLAEAGIRTGSDVSQVDDTGAYYSSTPFQKDAACYISYGSVSITPDNCDYRRYGNCVRLVIDIEEE